ncbi:DUF2723 domain-containing protein [Nonomuraea sp. NPDC046570]|uniref:protein O-mannosyl-transferase family n=1 Tax=Nonomuraea sp. NPDC046570 TaxID=3155255 RepID=UPI0033F71298
MTRSPRWPPLLAGFVAGLAAFSGSGAATLNGDELATVSAAGRSVPGLWELAQHIDGHFLPYYLFMHLWMKLGTAELWLRLPSAVAIGVAAAFLTDLARRIHDRAASRTPETTVSRTGGLVAGLTAAALFAVLPSVSYYGAFARSYAFAAAAVVIATWALHRAIETSTPRTWTLYAGSVALVGSTHLFAVLVLPAHLLGALLLLPVRTVLTRTLPAQAAGFVPAAVLGLIGYGERHAISWIPQRGPEVWLKFPKMAAGGTEVGLLLFAVALIGAFAVARHSKGWAATLLGWLILPPILLLAVSHLLTPAYIDRYLFVTAPALALLTGLAVAALPRWAIAAATALTLAAAVLAYPQHVEVREVNGRFEDVPWAVRKIAAKPGDAILYAQSALRTRFDYYTDGRMPDDVLRVGRAPLPDSFGYPELPDVATALEGRSRVWIVWRGAKRDGLEDGRFPHVEAARRAGFTVTGAWHSADLPGLTVALFTRSQR